MMPYDPRGYYSIVLAHTAYTLRFSGDATKGHESVCV